MGVSGPVFCCVGCRTAWDILHARGLEHYYALSERRGARVEASGRRFEEFDHAAFQSRYVVRSGDHAEADLYLEGIQCASCVWLVERVPLALPGITRAELDVSRSRVRVAWDPTRVALSSIARLLDTLGYRPHPFRGVSAESMRRAEDREALARIGVAGAIAVNVMLLALALYSGWFSAMEPALARYFRWLCLIVATPAIVWPGRVFFRSAWAALRARTLHMDVPIALALGVAWTRGLLNTVSDRGPIYFDGVATLVFLLLVGRFLQQRAQRAAADSADLLDSLSAATARVVGVDGRVSEVPVEALLPGMVCEVRAGDTVPADGEVVGGSSELDVSLLTGESRPLAVQVGEPTFAGTVNRSATLQVRVARTGEDTRLGHILREVERGAARRAPIVKLADRLAGAFVVAVLALAGATAALWWQRDPSRAVDLSIALLIVTCPCALALATPLAVAVAVGRAAHRGILIKGGDTLELLSRPSKLFLDKTGTVTEGRTSLVGWDGPDELRAAVLALERHSSHPIATGFAEAWREVEAGVAANVTITIGGGITGTVEGRRVVVGSPAFVQGSVGGGRAVRGEPATAFRVAAGDPGRDDAARTPVWVAVDGRIVAHARFGDPVRPESGAAIGALRERGWSVRLLSGDDPCVVATIGARLGFMPAECEGGVTPERKLAIVEAGLAEGPVVMVGDGVNDAAAIARASVGVGVGGGAEASLAAADVFFNRPGLTPLLELVEGAERTMHMIRRNIGFSLVYNVVGVVLAMGGWINPLIAAVLMPASSVTVVLASWWGRTFDAPPNSRMVTAASKPLEVAAEARV
jgi:Cu2+-exporting ATPase